MSLQLHASAQDISSASGYLINYEGRTAPALIALIRKKRVVTPGIAPASVSSLSSLETALERFAVDSCRVDQSKRD